MESWIQLQDIIINYKRVLAAIRKIDTRLESLHKWAKAFSKSLETWITIWDGQKTDAVVMQAYAICTMTWSAVSKTKTVEPEALCDMIFLSLDGAIAVMDSDFVETDENEDIVNDIYNVLKDRRTNLDDPPLS